MFRNNAMYDDCELPCRACMADTLCGVWHQAGWHIWVRARRLSKYVTPPWPGLPPDPLQLGTIEDAETLGAAARMALQGQAVLAQSVTGGASFGPRERG